MTDLNVNNETIDFLKQKSYLITTDTTEPFNNDIIDVNFFKFFIILKKNSSKKKQLKFYIQETNKR